MKANNLLVTCLFLHQRIGSGKYGVSAWIRFCLWAMAQGYKPTLYEAKNTVSKYVTIYCGNDVTFKVRFSNHKPIPEREARGDCDYFVGVTNMGVTKTEDVIESITYWLGAQ